MGGHRWAIAMSKSGGQSGEQKLEFTSEGEAVDYISLEQATLLAMEHARQNSRFYGWQYVWRRLAWQLESADEGEEYYEVNLSFQPAGRFRGSPGVEQFIIDKVGNIRMRQLLESPSGSFSAAPWLTAGIAVVAVAEAFLLLGTEWRPWAEATPTPEFTTQIPSFPRPSLIETPISSLADRRTPTIETLFDSGRGTGPYDRMTYLDYESEIFFTPSRDMDVVAIWADVWYCNGTCRSKFTIYDQIGDILATNQWERANTDSGLPTGGGPLGGITHLIANTKYRIVGHVSTTRSIGIYTAGSTNPPSRANGRYSIISASHIERGPIAFRITGN